MNFNIGCDGLDALTLFNVGRNAPVNAHVANLSRPMMQSVVPQRSFPEPAIGLKPVIFPQNQLSGPLIPATVHDTQAMQLDAKRAKMIQAQQIDGAIRLLQMQYNAIMSNVAMTQAQGAAMSSAPIVQQSSFFSQFELPRPEASMPSSPANVDTSAHRKRPASEISPDACALKANNSSGKFVLHAEVSLKLSES